ncbi:TetR family transcriptional regulator [Cryobacterium sp. 10I1]|uniref:TetR/AcrR family transcriptional regulator n=1 Tax=unclassified Cryobacterium TaxID=2649013 RepID=UPI002B239CCE|nr:MULTISPECIES: TetR family transcriptional regulator [unclassified Cryobacterium]MEB0002447.1 TetR family transcriptional regulator [Cryobacterium sp. RTC2.1]MEB0304302.1 TetR family transcriptional regulator [Cryobacterium sp. 10I1]
MRKGKPNDPERRTRILRAALEVIASEGVHAASYRRIAEQAGVPLGSTTYYFADLETLIVSAFETLRDGLEPRYAAPMRDARLDTDVVDALVAATCGSTAPTLTDIRLYEEMHLYGARSPRVAEVLRDLQEESLMVLRRSLPDGTARAVDALMWGWWSYRALHPGDPLDQGMVRSAYRALVDIAVTRMERGDRRGVAESTPGV